MTLESPSVNRRRLEVLRNYVGKRAVNKIKVASGERVKGAGRIEVYVGGRLFSVLVFPKNRLIDCTGVG